jgi:hypothetical protein
MDVHAAAVESCRAEHDDDATIQPYRKFTLTAGAAGRSRPIRQGDGSESD